MATPSKCNPDQSTKNISCLGFREKVNMAGVFANDSRQKFSG